jgi:hypothetical protein
LSEAIDYSPPPTLKAFIKDFTPGKLFYDWIVGPVGSGKTTAIFMKLVYLAQLQAKSPDGIRRSRAVIVRNTAPQLRDTTIVSWGYWFKDGQAGTWRATDKIYTLRFGDVECEVLFRPLDTEDDVQRVLSLEVTFAIIDEFVQIPRKIIEALAARCGRYPSKKDGGATNWGMWGSSNPSTEDNWWYPYLHRQCDDPNQNLPPSATYFKQPSGLADNAENIENLPGGRAYYTALTAGKAEAWVKQFVESEWGFSVSGQPVVSTLKPDIHFVKGLLLNPALPLVAGFDPGIGGSALTFGQLDFEGRLNTLGELVQSGYGAKRLISERLRPYIRARWPEFDLNNLVIAPDPAAANRAQTDEKSVVDEFKRHFKVVCETNNRFPLRLDAIEHFTTRLIAGGPALRIDEKMCPILSRALRGGWRFKIDAKKDTTAPEADKNAYSHPGDSFGYLCRYFHKATEREQRYGVSGARVERAFRPPRPSSNPYHHR